MIRAFIALEVPEATRERLRHIQVRLKERGGAVRWVSPDRVHVTLKFLGSVPEDSIPPIAEALEKLAMRTVPFQLRAQGCGAFPSMKQMRVIWVGLNGELKALLELKEEVEEAMKPLGFTPEHRAFKPHLTLGRVKGRQGLRRLQEGLLAEQAFEAEAFDVKELVLYKSDLRPEGAIYTPLFRARFKA